MYTYLLDIRKWNITNKGLRLLKNTHLLKKNTLPVVYINGRPAVRDGEIWLRTVKILNTQATKNIPLRVHTNVQIQSTNV